MNKHKGGLLRSFRFAFRGLYYAVKTQRNMRIHISMAVLVSVFGLLYRLAPLEWIALYFTITFVIVCEMLNTAVENCVDTATKEYNKHAEIAKDVAAGAVVVAALLAVIAFVLNYAAYFAEIFRAGIQSIDKGQFEAAKALGLSGVQTMWKIIIPQTVSRILPPVGNEAITLVKDTSLVSIIALSDIMRQTYNIVMRETNVAAFIVPAVFYLIMTFILTKLFDFLEKRFSRSERFEN